jgi:hypothetical protein
MQGPDSLARQSLHHRVLHKLAVPHAADPAVGSHPQIAVSVLQQAAHTSVSQTLVCVENLQSIGVNACESATRRCP